MSKVELLNERVRFPEGFLEAFCRRYHILKLSLFGSVLTDRFKPDSDIDVLIELDRHYRTTYFDLARMERELAAVLGRSADIRTPLEIGAPTRDRVLSESIVRYVA